MVNKQAIAVYNPTDRIGAAFQEAYHSASGQWMTAGEMKLIKQAIPTYRSLAGRINRNVEEAARLLFGEANDSQFWYYPCDILDLRLLLSSKTISWHAPIVLFSPKAARRLLPEYPLCLVLDRSVLKDSHKLGGILVREGNRLHLGESLKRIMIRDYLTEKQTQTIYSIVKDTFGFVPTYLMTDVPGIATEKVASTKGKVMSNWYSRMARAMSKQAEGPNETFNKDMIVGRQPSIPDENEMHLPYVLPHKMMSLKPGDRAIFRYDVLKLKGGAKTHQIPISRSLINKPTACTVTRMDDEHIWVRMDGNKEEQKLPLDAYVFLTPIKSIN